MKKNDLVNPGISRRNFLFFVGSAAGAAVLGSGVAAKASGTGVTITLAGEADAGEGGKWIRARAQEWAKMTGNRLEYVSRPNSSTETLSLYSQYWAAATPDVDVYKLVPFTVVMFAQG
jgi:trehalose/maltose transport system substrate-binding protein